MMREPLVNKKGEQQLDLYRKPLFVGQSVLIMDSTGSNGGRSSVSTGVIIGFERYVIALKDPKKSLLTPSQVAAYTQFLAECKSKHKTWNSDYEERERRGLQHLTKESVTSHYVIGCTDMFRKGWFDGGIFEV